MTICCYFVVVYLFKAMKSASLFSDYQWFNQARPARTVTRPNSSESNKMDSKQHSAYGDQASISMHHKLNTQSAVLNHF